MKRTVLLAGLALLAVTAAATISRAELKISGDGANMKVDVSGYPANFQAIYPNFIKKCAKCHGIDRTFVTLQTGVTPSGTPFDNAAIDAYGAKMLRKPDSDMSKQEVKQFIDLMKYMAEEAVK